MTATISNTTSAKSYITRNGGYPDKLALGTILQVGTRQLTVERSNGFVISGYWNNNNSDFGGVDLRTTKATLTVQETITADEYNAEWLAYLS